MLYAPTDRELSTDRDQQRAIELLCGQLYRAKQEREALLMLAFWKELPPEYDYELARLDKCIGDWEAALKAISRPRKSEPPLPPADF